MSLLSRPLIAGLAAFVAACATGEPQSADTQPAAVADDGWTDLLANGLEGFSELGGADWQYADGELFSTSGEASGVLLTPDDYTDFELTAEFYVGEIHNSGIFIRCGDRATVAETTCYEVNIYDKRPDPSGRTGGIPSFAAPLAQIDAAGKWNTYEIRAEADHVVVVLNGTTTVDMHDSTYPSGAIALQWGGGANAGEVRFRNVKVRRLGAEDAVLTPRPLEGAGPTRVVETGSRLKIAPYIGLGSE